MTQAISPSWQERSETLGMRLFAEPRLSADGLVACASCHVPERGFVDGLAVSPGAYGRLGARNTPTVLNAALQPLLFWDGRAASLEAQALGPLLGAHEMAQPNGAAVVQAIRSIPEHRDGMDELFGGDAWGVSEAAQVLAAYERTLVARQAPFDAYLRGATAAMSETARVGWQLYNGKARCNLCHALDANTQLFSDMQFHNLGIGAAGEGYVPLKTRAADLGRFSFTHESEDRGAFRTSDLRNVGITAPYMHDGSLATLWDVMDHYNRGGDVNPRLDGKMLRLNLSETEIDALVAFMFALTDVRYGARNDAAWLAQSANKNIRPEREP